MLLVIDVGNTNIVIGLFEGKDLAHSWRIQTSRGKTSDEYGMLIVSLLQHQDVAMQSIHDVILSSVVPPLSTVFVTMCKRYFGAHPLQVGPGLKTGMPILYENPREVGADRIVNAVAAYERYHTAGVVVDFGTATTFDAITAKGEYLGGNIVPGVGISAEALFQRASKLPRVEIKKPPVVIGRNTVHSMQAGIFFGYVGLVDGIVARMQEALRTEQNDEPVFVIATGGLGGLIASESTTIQDVASDLTLEGLRLLYERNRPSR